MTEAGQDGSATALLGQSPGTATLDHVLSLLLPAGSGLAPPDLDVA